MTPQEMKTSILSSLKFKDESIIQKVNDELVVLETTDGLESKNNLKEFYGIWQEMSKNKEVGQLNDLQSWAAYALGMTTKKPTENKLEKRRCFARVGLPDIDTDFDYFRRNEVYDYIRQKWGEDFVANIGTYGALKLRSVIRRIGKALDIANAFFKGKELCKTENEAKVSEILKSLPKQRGAFLKVTDENGKEIVVKTVEEAYKHCPDFKFYLDNYPEIRKYSKHIEGLLAIFGKHPAGIVISSEPIETLVPSRPNRSGKFATQYVHEDLERIGLIKLDILALASLNVIDRCVKMIKDNYDIDLDVNNLPLDDKDTLELYKTGRLTGVFQCETFPMQGVMKDIGVDRFEDIMAATALFRPGPMDVIPQYCRRKRGEEPIEYFHPTIEKFVKPFLEETYGFCVYQEQIMFVCNALAGFTITEGYDMIKGVAKKVDTIINKYESRFEEGCVANGVPREIVKQYWEKFIVKFANYGFNKSMLGTTEVMTPSGMKKLQDFQKGDAVYGVNEAGDRVVVPVVDLHDHGVLEAFEVTFNDGSQVVCSINHKFLTYEGQKSLREICRNGSQVLGTHMYQGESNAKKVNSSYIEMRTRDTWSEKFTGSSFVLPSLSGVSVEEKFFGNDHNSFFSMRIDIQKMETEGISSKRVSGVSKYKTREYQGENGEIEQIQFKSNNKSDILEYGEEDFGKTRDSSTTSGTVEDMEGEKSRKICSLHSCRSEKSEEFEDGRLVANPIGMGYGENTLREYSEAGGLREGECLDRSGRFLPFQRNTPQDVETSFVDGPTERFHAERGSDKTENYVNSRRNGLFCEFVGTNEGRMVEDISGHAKISDTRRLVPRKIIRVVSVGKERMYDLEVACNTHNFVLSNGVVTSNSHSAVYALVSWQTAYLKAHFPAEFFVSSLNVSNEAKDMEQVESLERDMPHFGIKLLPRKINTCEADYTIVRKADPKSNILQTEVAPSAMVKGVGMPTALNFVQSRKGGKYTDLRDIAKRTDTKLFGKEAMGCMIEAGFFDDYMRAHSTRENRLTGEDLLLQFEQIRDDLKNAAKYGVVSVDLLAD